MMQEEHVIEWKFCQVFNTAKKVSNVFNLTIDGKKVGLWMSACFSDNGQDTSIEPAKEIGPLSTMLVGIYLWRKDLKSMGLKYDILVVSRSGQKLSLPINYVRDNVVGSERFMDNHELLRNWLYDGSLNVRCIISRLSLSKNTLQLDMEELFESELFTDVTIVAGGQELKALKCILAARSDVFKAMFSHNLLERETSIINITDISMKALQELVRFIYTDRANFCDVENALDIFLAADKYHISGLKCLCESFVEENIKPDDLLPALEINDKVASERIKRACDAITYDMESKC